MNSKLEESAAVSRPDRRRWLTRAAATAAALPFGAAYTTRLLPAAAPPAAEPLPVAAVVTIYHKNSHADVIVGKILEGYDQQGGPGPGLKLASLYVDQVGDNDLSRTLAAKHGFRLARSIEEALTCGTDGVAVAGVLSIGEHGKYAVTPDTGQHMYPRRRFFDEIVAAFQKHDKVVPVFNDKHLSYRWEDARHMVDTARRLKFPLVAGSSLPVAWRVPAVDLPLDCQIEAALSLGYGGLEAYGFHALEGHQCLVERRRGGEAGIARVQAVRGPELWEVQRAGRWSRRLLEAALDALPSRVRALDQWKPDESSAVYLLDHRDGLKTSVLMANGLVGYFAFAAKLKDRDEPLAIWLKLQEGPPFGHFSYLLRAIEHTIRTGQAAYPIERTLLTTGILDRAMHSLVQNGQALATPELEISYRSANWPFANRDDSPLDLPNDG